MKLLLQLCVLVLLCGSVQPCIAASTLVDHYRKALEEDPQNHNLRYHLGIALLNQGHDRQALKAFRRAYPFRADDPEINFNLALVYSRLRDPDSALIYLDQAQSYGAASAPEIFPLRNVYFNLVLLYEEQGQLGEAVRLLRRLIGESSDHLEYLRLLGDFELRRGRIEEAIEALTRYLKQAPEDSEVREYAFAAFYNRGLESLEKQELNTARMEFARALQFSANSPPVFYYLALLDYREEKYSLVAGRLPQVYDNLEPEMQESARAILYNSALALKKKTQYKAALQALAPLNTTMRPRSKDLALAAGILFGMKKYDQARDAYLRVLQIEPGNGMAATGVQAAEKGAFISILDAAGAAFAANDLAEVRRNLRKAAEIYPKDNRLRIYQARLTRLSKESWLASRRQAEKLEGEKKYAEALMLLRETLTQAPEEQQLLRYEKRLVKLLSGRIDSLYRRGRAAFSASSFEESRSIFRQLAELSPSHQGAKDYLQRIDQVLQQRAQRAVGAAEVSLEQGNLLAARDSFVQALDAWPGLPAANEGLKKIEQLLAARVAETLVQARRARAEGRLLAARELLRDSLEKWPAESLAAELARVDGRLEERRKSLAQLTREAIDKRQFRQAGQLLDQAARLAPDAQEIAVLRQSLRKAQLQTLDRQLVLARKEIANGNYEAGLKAYRDALDLSPGNAEALAGLRRGRTELKETLDRFLAEGSAAHRAGKLDQARKVYREVLTLDPHQAQALAALRKIERAGRAGLTGADSRRLYLQGIELYTEGDYSQAIAIWRQVLDLDPENEKAQMNIDKAKRKLKQIQERKSG